MILYKNCLSSSLIQKNYIVEKILYCYCITFKKIKIAFFLSLIIIRSSKYKRDKNYLSIISCIPWVKKRKKNCLFCNISSNTTKQSPCSSLVDTPSATCQTEGRLGDLINNIVFQSGVLSSVAETSFPNSLKKQGATFSVRLLIF